MKEGEDREGSGADLALIAAAQNVEHYEIAGRTRTHQRSHRREASRSDTCYHYEMNILNIKAFGGSCSIFLLWPCFGDFAHSLHIIDTLVGDSARFWYSHRA
jgi:hypothetical protein